MSPAAAGRDARGRGGRAAALPVAVVAALGVVAALAGAVAAAAVGSGWATLATLAVAAAAETVAARSAAGAGRWAAVAPIGPPARAAAALLAALLLAGRTGTDAVLVATGVTAALVSALAAAGVVSARASGLLRRPPLLSRNLPLDDLRVRRAPSPLLTHLAAAATAPAAAVALGLAIDGGRYGAWFEAGLAVATVLAAAPPVALTADALALWRGHARAATTAAVTAAVARLRPQVVLYFAGAPEEAYQPEMWFGPVERLQRPALVLVRDPEVLRRLDSTSLPIVCAPYNGTVARLPLPPDVATLFVTHSGPNAAMLRRPEARSVFVGHGDSDKPDSVNPVARVYEQVWVAGPLGRRRYAEAGVGVRDDAIVEIGRPQLSVPGAPPPVPTVLYAPTWEGWGDDPHHSSLPHVGPALVRALLDTGAVRVLYRPHPLTGRRAPELRAAHAEVLGLLRAAGAADVRGPRRAGSRPGQDLLDTAIATGRRPQPVGADGEPAEGGAWAGDPRAHRVIGAGGPSLAACFAQASVLVADVSSVVSEWLVTDRAYAIPDTRGLGAEEFRRRFPAAAGGLVLPPDLAGLADLVAVATGTAGDPTTRARRRLTRTALGDPATSQERFAAAVQTLVDA